MIYENIYSENQLNVERILFVQIYDYKEECNSADSVRSGNFWELLHVEKGLVDISTPSSTYTLSKNELLFRRPSETFRIHMQIPVPAKIISIAFTCPPSEIPYSSVSTPSPANSGSVSEPSAPANDENLLPGKLLPVSTPERRLLQRIVSETENSHCSPSPFAAGQAALLYLHLLLILLIRNANADITLAPVSRSRQLAEEDLLFRNILNYMEEHIADRLTIDQICHDHLIGRALLQKLFAENTGCGIIDYFSLMKINAAKQLIRKGELNFSQIAEQLGYNSIHYFSRQFKSITGITPTEYASGLTGSKPI